jgi:hypothetical protein
MCGGVKANNRVERQHVMCCFLSNMGGIIRGSSVSTIFTTSLLSEKEHGPKVFSDPRILFSTHFIAALWNGTMQLITSPVQPLCNHSSVMQLADESPKPLLGRLYAA